MGITCKPIGTLKKLLKEVENEQLKEKEVKKKVKK